MLEQISSWLHSHEGLSSLAAIHWTGLTIALLSALAGEALAIRILLFARAAPDQAMIRLLHLTVIVGMCLFWCSGIALAVFKFSLHTLPPKVLFKIAAAAVLTINGLLLQRYLIPLIEGYKAPLAKTLDWNDLLLAMAIGSTSICCWISITAVALVTQLHSLPLEMLLTLFIGFWMVLFMTSLCVVLASRNIAAARYPIS